MFVVPCVDDDTTLFPLRMTKKDFNLSSIEKEFHEMCKESSHKRIVKFLRERTQMNIDAYDSYGWTALMKAAYLGRDDIVRVLLSFGATASVATVILKPNEFGDARDRIPAGSALHVRFLPILFPLYHTHTHTPLYSFNSLKTRRLVFLIRMDVAM